MHYSHKVILQLKFRYTKAHHQAKIPKILQRFDQKQKTKT